MHRPVLLNESIEALNIQKGERYIDATVGEGGHFQAMIRKGAIVLGIDRDEGHIQKLRSVYKDEQNAMFEADNFSHIAQIAKKNEFAPVSGVIFDLGLSNDQLQTRGLGLSYKKLNEPLDMRLDLSGEITAKSLLASVTEDQLYDIFAKNSEELNSRQIAHAIVAVRKQKPIITVSDLIKLVKQVVLESPNGSIARIFQALRIEVNNELNNLNSALKGVLSIVRPGGRIVIISFHSLEDRIVKQFIKKNNLKQLTKKIIKAGREHFTFERSAKLRVIVI